MAAGPTVTPGFDVESFAFVAPDRLVVTGRWFGVRGRRFFRPTLTVHGAGGLRPLLATLEHKPWAPDEEAEWIAAFPWDGGPLDISGAELAVAPDIAVVLPAPEGMKDAPAKPTRRPHRESTRFARPVGAAPEAAPSAEAGSAAEPAGPGAAEDVAAFVAERGAFERERVSFDRDRDAFVRETEALRRERDAAERARDAAFEARDAALAEREALRHERDALARQMEGGVEKLFAAERERLEAQLDDALAARDEAVGERDVAIAERDAARDARQAANVARKASDRERDQALQELRERPTLAAPEPPRPRTTAVDWTYRTLIVISIALALLLFGVVLSALL